MVGRHRLLWPTHGDRCVYTSISIHTYIYAFLPKSQAPDPRLPNYISSNKELMDQYLR